MSENSLSLSLVLMSRVAEVCKMWIWGAWFPDSQSCGKPLFLYIIIIYVCLATFNFKATVRVVSWQTALQCSGSCS